LLGEALGVEPARLEGLILGEHGDSMVPVFSSLRYDGRPMAELPAYREDIAQQAFAATRTAGAECLKLKGGAGYAVGLAVREVVAAILGDSGVVLPVSTLQTEADFAGVAFSRPTRVGRAGVLGIAPLALSDDEQEGLRRSAAVLRETVTQLHR
jgi:L-lactate dehydrogenase